MEKIAFLFPGQGTQFIQMGKIFYDNYEVARKTFEEVEEVSDINIADVCFNGTVKSINEFSNMQLSILATEVAIFRVYMQEYGIAPQFVVGHSVGEYAALVSTGALSLADAVRIMLKRGELVKRVIDKKIGHMTIVENCTVDTIQQCIEQANATGSVYVSCYNSEKQNAICGYNEKMEEVEELLDKETAVCTPLVFSPPIHSPLMNEICMEFLEYVNTFKFHDFRFPIICNYTGKVFSDKNQIAKILTYQLYNPVKFIASVEVFKKYGVTMAIEMSPKRLLADFVKADCPEISTYSYGVKKEKSILGDIISNDTGLKKEIPNFLGRCLAILAVSENKNQDTAEYKEVINIYNAIRESYKVTLDENKKLDVNEKKGHLKNLVKALRIKKVEETSIFEYIRVLLDETNSFYELEEFVSEL